MTRCPTLAAAVATGVITLMAFATSASAGNQSITVTPSTEEMTPSHWRTLQLAAADKSDDILKRAEKLPGLLAQYAMLQTTYDANHERAFQLIFGQYLSWYQTFIGDYRAARSTFSIAQPPQPDDNASPLNGNYTSRTASDVILEMSKDRKAVFFNEAHSAPITRTLTVQLLSRLRAQGFNYFAAETLYATDHDLNQRAYPMVKSGFYINEPIYGEMVRTALKLGFKVVAYDVENAGVGDLRERAGAENLYSQVFKKDPNARLVVNAGFAHVQKTGKYLGGTSMGEFFHKISGIDPLTIEQTMMIQHARNDQDHPIYSAAMHAHIPAQPSVFVDASGKPWTLKAGQYDMSVFFPPDNGGVRPDWLALGGLRVAYSVATDLCRSHFPCLIEARSSEETLDAVAGDRVVLNTINDKESAENRILTGHGESQSKLYLRPGNYRLTAMDGRGHIVSSGDITVGNRNATGDVAVGKLSESTQ